LTLSSVRQQAIAKMIHVVTNCPYMIYGENGFCTLLMEKFKGTIIGKRGASGVYLGGIVGKGIGFAVKMDDGLMGPQYNVTMAFLHWLNLNSNLYLKNEENESFLESFRSGVEDKDLDRFFITPNCNSMNTLVGYIECSMNLFQ
jgi:L-asparaginase II